MASLTAILTAINANLPAGTQVFFGEKYISSNLLRPNSVVWVPGQETYTPARNGRGMRSIRTRVVSLQAWIWRAVEGGTPEDDVGGVEEVIDAILVSMERVVGGPYDVTGGVWDAAPGPMSKGRSYTLAMTVEVPVLLPQTRAALTATEQDTGLALRTGDVSGVPAP
jgi:hypothetical protein